MAIDRDRPASQKLDIKPGRAMRALGELLRNHSPDPFMLFDASLELLIRQFTVDHALITRLTEGQLDTFWWVQAGNGAQEPIAVHQSLRLCERVLQEPEGSLVLGTVSRSEGGTWLRAFAGVVLREGGKPIGTLAVLNSQPFAFTSEDLDFIKSVAGHLGQAMEIENLKFKLGVAQESLALSSAVVQDSALETETTGLPNARFLDIWTKGHMHRARRQKEVLSLATWEGSFPREALLGLAQSLRGDDLMVEVARGRFLILLPQTAQEGAQIILDRVLRELGHPALGATLWQPDKDDLLLRAAQRRAELARQEAVREGKGGGVKWKLPTLVTLEEP
jgi:hypothetical protein